MVVLLGALLAVGYWLGGRRPLRVIDAQPRWGARQWRASAFGGGLLMVMASLVDPVDARVRQSFWLQTVQLIALVMVAAPLLVIGAPTPRLLRLFGNSGREQRRPLKFYAIAAFGLFNGALLLAYMPAVYHATASPGWTRLAGQLTMVGLGFLFWSQVIAQPPRRCALSHVERVFYLFLSSAQIRILGLVLGFASSSFYGTSLFDQQLAAGILLVPGVLTDLIVVTVCLYLWLGQDDHKTAGHIDSGGRPLPVISQRPAVRIVSESRTG